jgi:hypothetical protein
MSDHDEITREDSRGPRPVGYERTEAAEWAIQEVDRPQPLEWIASNLAEVRIAYRGYWVPQRRERTWPVDALVTGLERVCLRLDGSLGRAAERERAIIRQFRRRVHHYLPSMRPEEQSLELLALMQHHGAPTRLLDWTYSLYVAAHFALSHTYRQPGTDLAIWTIRPEWCRDASKIACETTGSATLWSRIDDRRADEAAGTVLLSNLLPRCIWPVNPFRLNERLTIQQGLFLAPGDVSAGFFENVGALGLKNDPSGARLTCYVIPQSRSREVARALYEMNVTEATLFPGLDGFARSLWSYPEIQHWSDDS